MKMNRGHFASILNKKAYATFDGTGSLKNLPGLCIELLSEQKKAWLDLREGCESLKDIRERVLSCRGFSVRLQHNPGRIKNSLADIGEKQIARLPIEGRPPWIAQTHGPDFIARAARSTAARSSGCIRCTCSV